MSELIDAILKRHDDGESVEAIRKAEGCGFGYVYGVLREHRPNRERKPRKRTGAKRKLVLGLLGKGHRIGRVVVLAKCTRAYVYKLMDEEGIAA